MVTSLFRCTPTNDPAVPPFDPGELPHSERLFTKEELQEALYSLNPNKAPGPDNLDFKILRNTQEAIPSLLHEWCNKCLQLSHFPPQLKTGEVVFFQKQDKDPSLPTSYRPICLLPTLGKLLEKLLQRRLNHHLEGKSLLSNAQYGFREARSCELAIANLLQSIERNTSGKYHSMIVSFDIKGAFDSVNWSSVKRALKRIRCPTRTRGLLFSFLEERKVTIDWGAGSTSTPVYAGCPQGSCLGPVLWLLVAESYLCLPEDPEVDRFAFADDFALVVRGLHRRKLEEAGRRAVQVFQRWTDEQNLEVSPAKSKLMVVMAGKGNMPRKPSLHFKDQVISAVGELRYLGITLDSKLQWKAHINNIQKKAVALNIGLAKVTSRLKGQSSEDARFWYKTVAEKAILYGASIWANNPTQWLKSKLDSIQRPFLIKIAKAYATTSTAALQVLTGIQPLHVTAVQEAHAAHILRGVNAPGVRPPAALDGLAVQQKAPLWKSHPSDRCIHLDIKKSLSPKSSGLDIYTDGSKSEKGVGSALVVFGNGEAKGNWAAKLSDSSSVFQAELRAIKQALVEAQRHTQAANIYSDSMSGLQALGAYNQTNSQVRAIIPLITSLRMTNRAPRFFWVPAHTGIVGNEAADQLAKSATERPLIDECTPAPQSFVKRALKEQATTSWQLLWDEAESGRQTYKYVPKVKGLPGPSPSHAVTALLTGHGPFHAYLHRFKISTSPNCACGEEATAEHYMFSCPLSTTYHFKRPGANSHMEWTKKLFTNRALIAKARALYQWLVDNQDLILSPT